jgi:hypothetical protein
MSMIMRSPGSLSLAHESLVFILSHLPSHRLQPPWGEIMIAFLGHLPRFLFLLPFRVIFFTNLSTLTRARFIYRQPKTSLGAQNMKMGPDALSTAENEYGSAKHENGPDALGTAENESGRAKHENGTPRTRHRRK